MEDRITINFNLDGDLNERCIHMLKNDLEDFIKNHELTYYASDISVDFQAGLPKKANTSELEPCPFCGGAVSCSYRSEQLTFYERKYRFKCNKCRGVFDFIVTTPYKNEQQSKREAIKIWNARAT